MMGQHFILFCDKLHRFDRPPAMTSNQILKRVTESTRKIVYKMEKKE